MWRVYVYNRMLQLCSKVVVSFYTTAVPALWLVLSNATTLVILACVLLHRGLICISLVTNDTKHLFLCFAIHVSFGKYKFKSFAHFKFGAVTTEVVRFLKNILDNSLPDVYCESFI